MLNPDDAALLFSPLEGTFPSFFLDESLTFLLAPSAKRSDTVRKGFSFLPHLSEESLALHNHCLSRSQTSRFKIFEIPQNSVLLPVTKIPGYLYLYLEYAYAPRNALIRGVLFTGRREYRRALLEGNRGRAPCLTQMRNADPLMASRFAALLHAEGAVGEDAPAFSLHDASLLAAQCLSLPAPNDGNPLFSLGEILECFCSRILSGFCFLDCETVLEAPREIPVFARLNPDRFLLLLASLLSILNVLAEDNRIVLAVSAPGENAQLDFRFHCPRLASQLIRCSDLQILLSGAPTKQFALTLSDQIIGLSGYEVQMTGVPKSGTVTLSLFIPREQQYREYKSPAASLRLLERALPAARGMLPYLILLSDTQEKK